MMKTKMKTREEVAVMLARVKRYGPESLLWSEAVGVLLSLDEALAALDAAAATPATAAAPVPVAQATISPLLDDLRGPFTERHIPELVRQIGFADDEIRELKLALRAALAALREARPHVAMASHEAVTSTVAEGREFRAALDRVRALDAERVLVAIDASLATHSDEDAEANVDGGERK